MSAKAWMGLAAATVVAVAGAAYVVIEGDSGTGERRYEETLFPGLMDRVNDVVTLTVRKGDKSWTITRRDRDKWVMVEKDDYPVSADKVKQAVVAVAGLKIVEEKTSNPDLYAKIDVADVDAKDSKSILLGLEDGEGKELARLLVGKTKSYGTDTKPAQVFVRKPGDKTSWLVEARLDIKGDALSWLDPETLKVTKGRVRRVVITHPDGEVVTVERDPDKPDSFTLRGVPKGYRQQSDYRLGAIAAGLEYVRYEDVRPADRLAFDKNAIESVIETDDGLRVTLRTITKDKQNWVRIDAVFDEALAGEDADKEAVKKEAEAIKGRVDGWAYLIPDYRAENFTRRMSDLIEKIEPAKDKKAKGS